MFSNLFVKTFRILLIPFSLLYWIGLVIRNWLYDRRILASSSFGLPIICIGNLSVGGTGKSPMVEYLAKELKDQYRIAILSRGYKRRTKGYALAGDQTDALEIGDEPMQFHLKFPDIPVCVGERRVEAVPQLLHDRPDIQAVLLDDAFQHRAIRAGLNILLTDCNDLFTRDFYLPTGDLRDLKSSYKRADIIVVTKCNQNLTEKERDQVRKEIDPSANQSVYFAAMEYGLPYHIKSGQQIISLNGKEVLLVTGIANPGSLKEYVEHQSKIYHMMAFNDHHIFSVEDLKNIRRRFNEIQSLNKIILTTEKDAVRLLKFQAAITELPIFVLPVRHRFLFGQDNEFKGLVDGFIRDFNSGVHEKK